MARPYDDELISSALIRGCRHFGLSRRTLADVVLNKARMRASFLSFGPLSTYEELFDVSAAVLLCDHTVVPYALSFCSSDVSHRAIVSAFSSESGQYGLPALISHIGSRRTRVAQFLRYCGRCLAEDEAALGETYWHRSHQLPGCVLCWKHGCVLLATGQQLQRTASGFDLPADARGKPCVVGRPGKVWQAVAEDSATLARIGLNGLCERPGDYYKRLAYERGWLVSDDRATASLQVADALCERFGAGMLEATGLLRADQGRHWWSLMLQKQPRTPFIPVKHILMEHLLLGEPSAISHKPVGNRPRDRSTLDNHFAPIVQRTIEVQRQQGRRCKKRQILEEAGCWQIYRRTGGASSLPKVHELISNFQRSPLGRRPLSLERFTVPGESRLALRSELVREGYLVGAREAAKRLGRPWTDMKRLNAEGRILSIPYMFKDWYPAYWCTFGTDQNHLEDLHHLLQGHPLGHRWQFFSTGLRRWKDDGMSESLGTRRAQSLIRRLRQPLFKSYARR